jgi:hypothetical protein
VDPRSAKTTAVASAARLGIASCATSISKASPAADAPAAAVASGPVVAVGQAAELDPAAL